MHRRHLLALGAAALPAAALAQSEAPWPSRPVSMVVGFAPGGANDLVMRLMAENLTRRFGQQFIVENRPGAGARVAAAHVARARPDGHTFLMGTPGILVLNPLIYRNMDHRRSDFTPISQVGGLPYALVVRRELPVNSAAELVAYAKARPGRLNHGSSGTGPIFVQHLFKLRTGTQFENVAYPGTPPALNDLLRGDIHLMFDLIPGVIGQIQAGAVRAIAVSAPARVPALPDVPTLVESGAADIDATNWLGIVGPAGLPAPIVGRMSEAIQEIVRTPAVSARLIELGVQPVGSSAADFARFVEREAAMWSEVAQRAGIQPE